MKLTRREVLNFLLIGSVFGTENVRRLARARGIYSDLRVGSGISFRHSNGAVGEKEFIEPFGSGVGILDYNNDGLPDIFLLNGASLPFLRKENASYYNRLYRNEGNFKFTDVTLAAGVQGKGYSMGVTVGDFDNDGYPDLYVTGFGKNQLFHNRGDGSFEDATEKAGVAGGGWSTSAAFLDYDRDGCLDLYICRYVDYEIGKAPRCGDLQRGLHSYCLPDLFNPVTDLLYHNNGDGTFTDVSHEAGIDHVRGRGLGVTVGDFDRDGWIDIFVANDRGRNFLFHNKKNGTFEEVGLPSGVAYSLDGVARAGMGTDFGDFDEDGWPDIFVSNFETEGIALFRNVDGKYFIDVAGQTGLRNPSYPYVGFGGGFIDYDNDGLLDIFVGNGHTQDDISRYKSNIKYAEPKLLFRNSRGHFVEDRDGPGGALSHTVVSRGVAFVDLDNDGAIDVVINNNNDYPEILRNEISRTESSLLLKLKGTRSNRDGIGTRLEIQCENQRRFLEAHSAASYLSANDIRIHVGLGRFRLIDMLTLHWPSGTDQRIPHLAAGYLYTIDEDKGILHAKKLATGG